MTRPGLPRLARAATVAALVLAGCGGGNDTVDTAQVEQGIKQQLSTPTADVTSVKCPQDQPSQTGGTFECSVKWSNGATGKVEVTQESGRQFTYAPVSGSVQVPGSTVEKSVEQQLAKQGMPDAQATCPANVVVKVGTTVTCTLTGAGGNAGGTVTFTFSDAEGTVDPASVQTA